MIVDYINYFNYIEFCISNIDLITASLFFAFGAD